MSFRNDTLEAKAREHVWRATSPRARPTQDSTSRGTTRCVCTSFPAHSLDSRARALSSSSPKPRAVEIRIAGSLDEDGAVALPPCAPRFTPV
jgi:hypothetical protein